MMDIVLIVDIVVYGIVGFLCFGLLFCVFEFIRLQTGFIREAFGGQKYSSYTEGILRGSDRDLKEARKALRNGDIARAKELVCVICFNLAQKESDTHIRKQLQRKLSEVISRY